MENIKGKCRCRIIGSTTIMNLSSFNYNIIFSTPSGI